MSKPKPSIGGQAVIEGVMMKGPTHIATAVREPSGTITLQKEPVTTISDRYPLLKKPMLRGVIALGESLIYGLKALSFSAQAAGEEDEQLSTKEIAMTMLFRWDWRSCCLSLFQPLLLNIFTMRLPIRAC